MYNEFLRSKMARQLAAGGKQTMVLPAITNLKKLCNHPSLIVDSSTGRFGSKHPVLPKNYPP